MRYFIFLFGEGISMKFARNIRHMSKKSCKGFQGQTSRSLRLHLW